MTIAALSRRLALLSLTACGLMLTACGGGNDGKSLQLRALNLSADLPRIDLIRDETAIVGGLAQDELGAYVRFDAGTYTLRVRRAGDAATLVSGSYSLSRGQHLTAVIWGRETSLNLTTLGEDENADNITAGNSRLRVFNATTDSGSVDVYLTAASTDIGDINPTQDGVVAGAVSAFRDLSAGSYRLRVTGAGDPDDLRLDIPEITLGSKQHQTLVLTAGASGVLLDGTLVLQQGTARSLKNDKARVRLAASVNNNGNVSVSAGGSTLVGGLRSPSVGPYTLVSAGITELTLRVNGNVISSGMQNFVAGTDHTLLTWGAADAAQLKVLTDDNRLPTRTSRVKLRLVHGAQGADPLTLSVDYLALAIDQSAGDASAYATTNAGSSVRVDVTTAAAPEPLFSATEVNLQAQAVYTVFMLGGNAAPTGLIRKER